MTSLLPVRSPPESVAYSLSYRIHCFHAITTDHCVWLIIISWWLCISATCTVYGSAWQLLIKKYVNDHDEHLKAKMQQIRFLVSVRLCLRWVWHITHSIRRWYTIPKVINTYYCYYSIPFSRVSTLYSLSNTFV